MNKNEVVEVLMRSAEEQGLIPTLYAVFGKGLRVSLPLSRAVCAAELDNLEFSVRATNALKRSLHILLPKCPNLRNNFNQKPFHFFILIL